MIDFYKCAQKLSELEEENKALKAEIASLKARLASDPLSRETVDRKRFNDAANEIGESIEDGNDKMAIDVFVNELEEKLFGVQKMRLINVDTAEKKLAELIELYEKRMPNWSPNDMLTSGRDAAFKWGFKADGAEKALEIIKDMPTVDVEPVKHGRWILKDIWIECSNCKKTLIRDHIERAAVYGNGLPEYCPHCGAKMDEKHEGKSADVCFIDEPGNPRYV